MGAYLLSLLITTCHYSHGVLGGRNKKLFITEEEEELRSAQRKE